MQQQNLDDEFGIDQLEQRVEFGLCGGGGGGGPGGGGPTDPGCGGSEQCGSDPVSPGG